MAPRKSKRQRPTTPGKSIEEEEETKNNSPPSAFQALLSDLQSPKGISQSVLQRCYLLLNHLSSFPLCIMRMGHGVEVNACNEETGNNVCHPLVMDDIVRVADFLFKELSERFGKCFSLLSHEDCSCASDEWDSFGIVCLLLRCCLVLLTLPEINQEYLILKGQVILGILRQLRSIKSKEKNLNQGLRSTEDFSPSLHFLEPSGTCLHFVSAMHEVVLDEFSMHGELGSFFMLINSFDQPNGLLCVEGDVGILLEVIFCHFSLSISGNQDIVYFLNQLFGVKTPKFRRSEISPNAATVLLRIPIILYAPEFMQAYIIGLVSKSFSNSLGSENLKPDCQLMSCLLPALENSVDLYTKYRQNFQPDRSCKDDLSSSKGENLQPSFESFILPDTGNEMNRLIAKLNDSPESYSSNMANKTKTDIVRIAICYIKECKEDLFDKSFQDEIFSILTRVVTEASESLEYAVPPDDSIQSLCKLAAVLKLMSTVLLRAVTLLRYNGDPNHPKCLSDVRLCKDYDILESMIGCFGSPEVQLPVQNFLCNLLKTSPTKHENSRMMFLHFSGLLSHALNTGFDFLIKGSLLALMALMNLFVFEEGSLDVFCQLFASSSEPAPSGLLSVGTNETCTKKKHRQVVASSFPRTRTSYMRSCKANCSDKYEHESSPNVGTAQNNDNMNSSVIVEEQYEHESCSETYEHESSPNIGTAQNNDNMNSSVIVEEQTEEKSNGGLYLKWVTNGEKLPDFDVLASFIDFEPGKDYSKIINRSKIRERRVDRWKRKMKTWRTDASKRTSGVLQRSKKTWRTASSKKTLGVLQRSYVSGMSAR